MNLQYPQGGGGRANRQDFRANQHQNAMGWHPMNRMLGSLVRRQLVSDALALPYVFDPAGPVRRSGLWSQQCRFVCYDDHMDVGIRDLKARLSEHLERVASGEVITVTSRGRRVAQIVPVAGRDNLVRGLAEGWITRQADRPPQPVVRQRPLPGTPTTTELISQDRGA